jgi:hypothetical protein
MIIKIINIKAIQTLIKIDTRDNYNKDMLDNLIFNNLNHINNMDILSQFILIIHHNFIPKDFICLFSIFNIKIMMKFYLQIIQINIMKTKIPTTIKKMNL